ncbi:MAG: hypothetical protein HY704_09430 [Gemmatimonadetes bacterium]|nr:hypothetical protein [Gemmatimonadota bacterium]
MARISSQGGVEHTIGHASYHDISVQVPEVLRRYGYAIYNNVETGATLYIETNWMDRAPFEDEAKKGVDAARTRFIFRARKSGPATFTLRVHAENQVRGVPNTSDWAGTDWTTIPATEMYKAYVLELSTEIQLKVDAGLRTYGPAIPPPGSEPDPQPGRAS